MRSLQSKAMGNCDPTVDANDIPFNFLIGGDGLIFEGRGFNTIGQHSVGFDDITLGIGFIGNFTETQPNESLLDATLNFFGEALRIDKFAYDYRINLASEFGGSGPGEAFETIIKSNSRSWHRYSPN